ncbi:hypothetical protein K2173_026260 [Erythroxylum novogranatense]|uniref:BHLH domain-containing protein n=1 Tax=Erythroxylum novogranatense TaxID=1862640 RepID=A0AAV8SC70_9ROSI|nr:hypothetical protein K2173_026260 [Erythroxylum novogranatense]
MVTDLHCTLRSLCLNTEWKYAVFWKLKYRARMVLTWEDAYYDNCELCSPSEGQHSCDTLYDLHGGHYSQDLLGLAVAKMSYHVYSLGEGIVGQVAVTGKHQWIFTDKLETNSFSSFGHSDGWQGQFAAGIRTVVVVAVAPYGVLQLGSFNKVVEDMKLVTHIKDAFFTPRDSSIVHVSSPLEYSMKTSFCPPGLPIKVSTPGTFPDSLCYLDGSANKEGPNDWLPMFPELQRKSDDSSYVSSVCQKTSIEAINNYDGVEISSQENDMSINILPFKESNSLLEHQNQAGFNLISEVSGGETSIQKLSAEESEQTRSPHSNDLVENNMGTCYAILPRKKFKTDFVNSPTELFERTLCDGVKPNDLDIHMNGGLDIIPKSSDNSLKKDLEYQTESSHSNISTFLKFSAGYELLEALKPISSKNSMYFDCEAGKAEAEDVVENLEMSTGMNEGHMTFDSGSESLLEAVVGNICYGGSEVKSEKSVCTSIQSLLATEKMPETSIHANNDVHSAGCSISQFAVDEESMRHFSNSKEVCGANSNEFSSVCLSTCGEQLDRCSEPDRNKKKRARPGENSRPRPRDRQLIQDRIKELRLLVPHGSKCSIDSLLEHTIKHMLFLESITKHAAKVNKCAETKMHHKATDGSCQEQGSSWALEVESPLKVSSIVAENLNKTRQMLVEMMCDECSHFLEIAEAIRSLGLTILKGITELHGEKTWMCFVVEGQNIKVMHRMDVLRSLVQALQHKATS